MNGYQIEVRCRVRGQLGEMLHGLPRTTRSRAVAALLVSVGEGINLDALLESREDLRRTGILLNQSLRLLYAGKGDVGNLVHRIESVLAMIDVVCAKREAQN